MRAPNILALLAVVPLTACNGDRAGGGSPLVVRVPASPATPLAIQVTAGDRHACAVTREGGAFCWGANESGQLGNGTTVGSLRPVAVSGAVEMNTIVAGRAHTCAISDRRAVCW